MGKDRRQDGGRPSVRRLLEGPRRELVTGMRLVATEHWRWRRAGHSDTSEKKACRTHVWTWDDTAARTRVWPPGFT